MIIDNLRKLLGPIAFKEFVKCPSLIMEIKAAKRIKKK